MISLDSTKLRKFIILLRGKINQKSSQLKFKNFQGLSCIQIHSARFLITFTAEALDNDNKGYE